MLRMALLSEEMRGLVLERLKNLPGPVGVVLLKDDFDGGPVPEIETLLQELSSLSDKVRVQVFNRAMDSGLAAVYGVEKSPAIVLEGPAGSRVRFYGMPDQAAFFLLLESLLDSARGQAELAPAVKRALAGRLRRPMRIQVFVDPDCPFCLMTARTAHRFAVAYPQITATVIEAGAFPDLVRESRVFGLPKTVINGRTAFQGAMTENALLQALLQEMASPPAVVQAVGEGEAAFEP